MARSCFEHALLTRLRGYRLEAARLAPPFGPLVRLAEDEGRACGASRGGGGLGLNPRGGASMANDEHVALLKQGVTAWNAWRDENPDIRPDLRAADFRGAQFAVTSLSRANLSRADLSGADLSGAHLFMTNLIGADLSGADLRAG